MFDFNFQSMSVTRTYTRISNDTPSVGVFYVAEQDMGLADNLYSAFQIDELHRYN